MAEIVINDILDQIKYENKQLIDQNNAVLVLLEKYKHILTQIQGFCVCSQKAIKTLTIDFANDLMKVNKFESHWNRLKCGLNVTNNDNEIQTKPKCLTVSKDMVPIGTDNSSVGDSKPIELKPKTFTLCGYTYDIDVFTKEYVCPHDGCHKKYVGPKGKSNLQSHIKTKHFLKQFKCDECPQSYPRNCDLTGHKKRVHSLEQIVYKCHLCDFSSKYKNSIETHRISIHTERESSFECDFEGCHKSFRDIYYLKRHKLSVHSDRSFACDWPGCDFRFVTEREREDHKRTHLPEKTLQCTFEGCDKMFRTLRTMSAHRLRHTKKYVCHWPECGQKFALNPELIAHTRGHQNVRPFKCYINDCSKDFRIKGHLDHHIRTVHKTKPIPTNQT